MNTKKYKCTTFYGAPCLEDLSVKHVEKRLIADKALLSKMRVIIMDKEYSFELVPVGRSKNMGHGEGSGYSASGLKLEDGTIITGDVICVVDN